MSVETSPVAKRGLEQKWKVLITVMFGLFMVILDSTIINIAFPTLRREFGASLADAQWVISIYVLALGITTPVSGYLADRFGIKRVYLLGLAIFVLGSFLCGIAPSLGLLIAARALQGFGGGIAQPLGPAQLYRAFPPKEQGAAFGVLGIALVVAPALGPILGGWLVDINLWRAIFFVNVPIGIIGVILGSDFLLDFRVDRKPLFDPLGLLTAIIGFGAILYSASIAENFGWGGPFTLLALGFGFFILALHVLIELRLAKEPLMDLQLFLNPTFLIAALVGYIATIALFGAEFMMPIYLQAFRGRTALDAGIILLAVAATSAIATPSAGRLYDKIGPACDHGGGVSDSVHQHLATICHPGYHTDFLYRASFSIARTGNWIDFANILCQRIEQRSTRSVAARFLVVEQHPLCRPGHFGGGAGDDFSGVLIARYRGLAEQGAG